MHRKSRRHPRRRVVGALLALAFATILLSAGTLWLRGYRVYVVHTGSMMPTYNPGDVVLDGPPGAAVRTGEVITFRHGPTADVVTHRVVSAGPAGITTKGDANPTPDAWTIPADYVKGHAVARLPGFGYLAVFLRQPSGIAALATGALSIIFLWGLFFPSQSSLNRSLTASIA